MDYEVKDDEFAETGRGCAIERLKWLGKETITHLAGDEKPAKMVVLKLFWVKDYFENLVEVTVSLSKKSTSAKNFSFHLLWIIVIPLKPAHRLSKNTHVKISCTKIFKS